MKAIGDVVYWVEAHTHYGKVIPCPMCFGKRFVTIILGDDTRTESICGMCSHGLEEATGQARTWDAAAFICSGQITGISTRDGLRYEVGSTTIPANEALDTEELAEAVRDLKQKDAEERRDSWFKEKFVECKKNQLWSAGYHRECIKYSERTIEWHKTRLNMIRDRKSGAKEGAKE